VRDQKTHAWERGRPRPHAGETPAIPDNAFPRRPQERCKTTNPTSYGKAASLF